MMQYLWKIRKNQKKIFKNSLKNFTGFGIVIKKIMNMLKK